MPLSGRGSRNSRQEARRVQFSLQKTPKARPSSVRKIADNAANSRNFEPKERRQKAQTVWGVGLQPKANKTKTRAVKPFQPYKDTTNAYHSPSYGQMKPPTSNQKKTQTEGKPPIGATTLKKKSRETAVKPFQTLPSPYFNSTPTANIASTSSKIEFLHADLTMGASDKRQMAYEHYLNSVISQMKTMIAHGIQIKQIGPRPLCTVQIDFDDVMVQRGSLRAYALHLIEGLLGCGAQVILLSRHESHCREMTRNFQDQLHYSAEISQVESIRICSNLLSHMFHCRNLAYIVPLISSADLDRLAYDAENDEELLHLTGYLVNELLPVITSNPDKFPSAQQSMFQLEDIFAFVTGNSQLSTPQIVQRLVAQSSEESDNDSADTVKEMKQDGHQSSAEERQLQARTPLSIVLQSAEKDEYCCGPVPNTMLKNLSRSFEESLVGLKAVAEQSMRMNDVSCGNLPHFSFDSGEVTRLSRQNPTLGYTWDKLPQRKERTWDSPEQEKTSTISEADYLGQIGNSSSDANLLNYSDSKAALMKQLTATSKVSKRNLEGVASLQQTEVHLSTTPGAMDQRKMLLRAQASSEEKVVDRTAATAKDNSSCHVLSTLTRSAKRVYITSQKRSTSMPREQIKPQGLPTQRPPGLILSMALQSEQSQNQQSPAHSEDFGEVGEFETHPAVPKKQKAQFENSDEIKRDYPEAIWGTLRRFIRQRKSCCSGDDDLQDHEQSFSEGQTPIQIKKI